MIELTLTFDIDEEFDVESTLELIKELVGNGATTGKTLDDVVYWYVSDTR